MCTVVLITYIIILVGIYFRTGSFKIHFTHVHNTLHLRKSYFLLFIIHIAADFHESNKKNKSSQFLQIWQVKAIFKDLLFAHSKFKTIIHFIFFLSLSISLYLCIFFNYWQNRYQTAVDWCDWINAMIIYLQIYLRIHFDLTGFGRFLQILLIYFIHYT